MSVRNNSVVLGGHTVNLVGAAAADFAAEFSHRERGVSPVVKPALTELRKLLVSKEITTAQKRCVDDAIHALSQIKSAPEAR